MAVDVTATVELTAGMALFPTVVTATTESGGWDAALVAATAAALFRSGGLSI